MPAPLPRSPSPAKAQAIVDAAETLFLRHGFRRTAMDDIARAAGVAKGTVYLYFANKEAVFDALHARMQETVLSAAAEAAASDAPLAARLFGVVDAFYGYLARRYAHSDYYVELDELRNSVTAERAQALREAHFEILAGLFRNAARAGEIPAGDAEAPRRLAAVLLAAARGAKAGLDPWMAGLDYPDRLRRITEVIAAAARAG